MNHGNEVKNEKKNISIALAGNPNCGKTTLFNDLTGSDLKVANWPGVTVEKKEGTYSYHGHKYNIVDLPGTYSLTSYTMEEIVAREYILSDDVDVIVNVVDASSLERNLYLTLQLIELGKPVVIALNMMDIVSERGMEIDLHRLPEMLGIPVIPVSARKKTGLGSLMHAIAHHMDKPFDYTEHHHSPGEHLHSHHDEYTMVYSDEIEDLIDDISEKLSSKYPKADNLRWKAIKILEGDKKAVSDIEIDVSDLSEKDYETEIINQKYAFIEEIMAESVLNRDKKSAFTDKVDAVLTHKFFGLLSFFAIMALVFILTFAVGDFLKGYLETFIGWGTEKLNVFLLDIGTHKLLVSLVVDGVLTGVGGILTFLPNIVVLFIALAFMEDSGYMARVAYVMDGLMSKIGLSGRAFIPMVLGFGCTVPAVMATRTLENEKDRIKTIMVTPFMSCSARLPIYVLFSEMFFGDNAVWVAYSMYLIGIIVAIVALMAMKVSDSDSKNDLLIELPEYKTPNAHSIRIYVWNKVKDYLTKAGTVIFIFSIIIWLILNFNMNGMVTDISESFGASIGKILVPVLSTAGLGYWQIALSLIAGIAAKEIVVSSMSVLYGVANVSSEHGMNVLSELLANEGFTAVNAYSMMLFALLYIPCAATIATIARETKSLKYTAYSMLLQLFAAWSVSTVFYQIAIRII